MSTAVQTTRLPTTNFGPWRSLVAHVRRLARNWAMQRDYARARFEFERIDEATLRDIGITRSELGSFWAEARGLAEPTRVRLMRPTQQQHPL
jgi:uncharacterized protein YjiS (DUF1127 family)